MRFEVNNTTILSPWLSKRRRLTSTDSMDSDAAKAKLGAISEQLGREIRVFETLTTSPTSEKATNEEPDDFYEFTTEDYYRVLSTKKEDKFLKTRKIREAEEAARRSRISKAIIRVRFPDNYTLEAKFHPSETFQTLIDLLMKVVSQPDIPFYIYTTPPKRQIKNLSQDFFSAGFIPGAIVYFSYDPNGEEQSVVASSGPFLREEIRELNGLHVIPEHTEALQPAPEPEPAVVKSSLGVQVPKPSEKKPAMPKWFKR